MTDSRKPKHYVGQKLSAVHMSSQGTALGNGEVVTVTPKNDGSGSYTIEVRIDSDVPGKTHIYVLPPSGQSDYLGEPLPVSSTSSRD